MSDARGHKTRGAFVALLLIGVSVGGAAAQEVPDAPDHPGDEPSIVDIPESDNPQVAAASALREGQRWLKSAHRNLAKASEAEGKKREKLEGGARKDFETAAESFLVALRHDKDLVEAYLGLGEAWLETGQAEKALQAWGAAGKRAPNDPAALFGLGRCLLALDKPRDAASVYLSLADSDAQRAAELLALLRAWGEPRAAEGDEEARKLLDWIEEQQQG